MLKRFSTAWGTYRTLVRFTVCPSCNFMFTEPFSLHFIFWPFSTVTFISNFSTYFLSFVLYAMCDDAMLSPNHSLISSLLFPSWTYPNNVYPTKRFLMSSSSSFPFPPNNQQPCGFFFHSCYITRWKVGFLQSYCCFCCHFYCWLPNSVTLCGHTWHNCYMYPCVTLHSCCSFYFLRRSIL